MTKRRSVLVAFAVTMLACAFIAGYRAHVLAEGAPTMQPLFYSGTLEVSGAPASGEYTVTMTLHDAASGGNELCGVDSMAMVEAGRFRIDASDCREAVAMQPDAWVQVSFTGGDGVEHAIPGRAKIGAVPYALQADHAVSASAPVGALAATIQQLTERVNALEVSPTTSSLFVANKTTPQTIAPGPGRVVIFDDEKVDLGDEYDKVTGAFEPKAAGVYEFSCTIAWDIDATTLGTWEVALAVNGFEKTYNGSYGDGTARTKTLTAVIPLVVGDWVHCTALQSADATPLNVEYGAFNTFSGHRL